jgi:spermine oxidase
MFHFLIFAFLNLCLCSLTTGTPSVIIIGAGPAGIAAASKLFENSITNITVLEAENRVGGRINSVKFGDKFVDLGAEYCHGKKNNIVYELVKDLNVLEPISDVFEPRVYYSNGSRLDPVFIEELQAVILGYDSHISHFNETGSSIGELFVKKYNATIIQKYSGDSKKIKILNEALRLAEKVSLMIDGAFSWLDTSTVKHYERSEGHQLLVWKGRGYRTVLDVLTGAFPDPERKLPIEDKILLNKQVSKIVWNGDSQVVVHTSDNSSYNADHVIFTPSVGVLKELKDSLFTPSLPSSKQDAIEAIGIAGVMKIVLHFETEWWKSDDVIFSFIWREEDLLNIAAEFSAGPVKNGVSWVSAITVMAKVPGNPNILIAWVTGDMVPDIEQTSLSVLKDGCNYLMNKFLGQDYNISAIDQILKTTWRSNHHFRGTYSYERAGFENPTVRHQSVLSDPLTDVSGKPVVLFAGEASNPVHYSTVHGAIETGRREALRLIDLYKH